MMEGPGIRCAYHLAINLTRINAASLHFRADSLQVGTAARPLGRCLGPPRRTIGP